MAEKLPIGPPGNGDIVHHGISTVATPGDYEHGYRPAANRTAFIWQR